MREKSSGGLGWFFAVSFTCLVSSPAWGLDLGHAIERAELDSAEIVRTLGRDKAPQKATSKKVASLQVQLIKNTKGRIRR